MSSADVPLFDRSGRPTVYMMRQWSQKAAQEPIRSLPLLERDRSATLALRRLWTAAFPTREALPDGPLVDADGRATDAFWRVFS